MAKQTIITLLLLSIFFVGKINSYSQNTPQITKKIIGTFQTTDTQINGFSFGLYSGMDNYRDVTTNGLRLEIPGIGMISFIGNGFPNRTKPFNLTNYAYSEIINGLNLSSGSWCDCNYNGVTIGLVGQYGTLGNGISLAGGWNVIDKQNGLQASFIANSSYYFKGVQISFNNYAHNGVGLQIGVFNTSKNFKGIQLGLWNVNQKRKLPLINWNF